MDQYVRATSNNLPKMDSIMILEYVAASDKHNVAEIRGAKALMSSKDGYVDSAVGFVELRRKNSNCSVRCKVVPEHKVNKKHYLVTTSIDEREGVILDTSCDGCAASAGGCKHSLMFLYWLNKRSSEPSSTSVACYWKKSALSAVQSIPIESENIFVGPSKKIKLAKKDPSILHNFLGECKRQGVSNSLAICFTMTDKSYNVFDMTLRYLQENVQNDGNVDFIKFKEMLDEEVLDAVESINKDTLGQVDSKLWHSVRQGRITASKLYEASQCKTDGTLVQQILGGYKVPETEAIKRGKRLETAVLKTLEETLGQAIEKCGFILINGLVGASPDGIGDNFTVEVKCPMTEKTLKNYVHDGVVNIKVKTQMQAQMMAAKKKKGVLCLADPTYEQTKKVHIYWMEFDKDFTTNIINGAVKFWEQYVFSKIIKSAKV